MNTAELIYQEARTLPESTRLEVLGFITLTKQKLAEFKSDKGAENPIMEFDNADQATDVLKGIAKHKETFNTNMNNAQEQLNFLNHLANQAKTMSFAIDMDDFEKSRQDRELDR